MAKKVNPASLKNLKPWRPGETGNPSGRGVLQGAIRKELEEAKGDKTKLLLIVRRLIDDSLNGDHVATRELLDRGYGKAQQQIDVTADIAPNFVKTLEALIARDRESTATSGESADNP